MELSPLAKEKLAKIGELTPEEKLKLKYAEQLDSLLSGYFTGKQTPEGLCNEVKKLTEDGKGFLAKEVQIRLLDAIALAGSDADYDRQRRGIVAVESSKKDGKAGALEQNLKAVEALRRQYREEKEKAFQAVKANVEQQIRMAAQQVAARDGRVPSEMEIQTSIDAAARSSNEWRAYMARLENAYGSRVQGYIAKIKQML